eukprot:CAMPEP_0201913016 /NCGR_PEP_ID=MMETSP0903-20130614/3537_1 /ASSEMBLY_ACC=CAM_ASM_000552 /TAXON_ID=420261 /ORGANISM="Thalassiosira antarctica, Strain CCMP982" /LENGTH=680 /DNA_ID=CAMNT_0048448107 /DNA_START=124 /DNA_END=2166 /DNA_ORIENTATION=-
MEPINKKNKRHFSKIEKGSTERRASSVSVKGETSRPSLVDKKEPSVRWADLVGNLNELDITDLDDPKHDMEVFESFNYSFHESDDKTDSGPHESMGQGQNSMGRISMGSWFSEDSVIRGLGGSEHMDTTSISDEDASDMSDSDVVGGLGEIVEGDNTKDETTAGRFSRKTMMPGNMFKTDASAWKKRMTMHNFSTKSPETSAIKKRSLSWDQLKMPEPLVAGSPMKRMLNRFSSMDSKSSGSSTLVPQNPAITSIAVLSDGFFLTASRFGEKVIKMYKTVDGGEVKFVREFRGHKSGVTALVTLDRKGRFMSAGIDKTVRLWDSRFDCEEELDDEGGSLQEPLTLLATFHCFKRWIHSIEVLNEGSFVRPTDDVDMAMVTAMAKKTALEGAASVQRAAIQREIIECSGSFVTASKNDKNVNVWEMTVAEKREENDTDENVAEINRAHVLEHDVAIGAMAAVQDMILTGDVMGVVYMWGRKRRSFGSWSNNNSWTKLHKFIPWKRDVLRSSDEISEQSILKLCILGSGTFVSGTKSGKVRVWDTETAKTYEVYKKHATSIKVTSGSVSGIQKLPPVKDPNTGEECEAFSVASTDGRVMSMALYPQDSSKQVQNELVMFHVYDNSPTDDESKKVTAISSIANSEAVFPPDSKGTSCYPVLITGNGNGDIHLLKTQWSSEAGL